MVHQEGARLNKFVGATRVTGAVGLRSKGRVAAYAITAGVWTSGVAWLLFHYSCADRRNSGPNRIRWSVGG
jgi:hypothetical protein